MAFGLKPPSDPNFFLIFGGGGEPADGEYPSLASGVLMNATTGALKMGTHFEIFIPKVTVI